MIMMMIMMMMVVVMHKGIIVHIWIIKLILHIWIINQPHMCNITCRMTIVTIIHDNSSIANLVSMAMALAMANSSMFSDWWMFYVQDLLAVRTSVSVIILFLII